MTLEQFEMWFGNPIGLLLDQSGNDYLIAALMLSLSCAEAFVRARYEGRTGIKIGIGFNISGGWMADVRDVLSGSSITNDDDMQVWWHAYRNGFIHNLDFNDDKGPQKVESVIDHTFSTPAAVERDASNPSSFVARCNPRAVCRRVLDAIRADEPTLARMDAPKTREVVTTSPGAAAPVMTHVSGSR